MRVLFVGTVLFSKHILEEIIKSKVKIVGVIGGRKFGFNSDYFDLVKYSRKKKIDTTYSNNINSLKTFLWAKKRKPDIIFCIGWSNLLKKNFLSLAPNGVIGYHPSELPQNRGRHPIIWSLALGLKKIGSCFFFMNTQADSGRIISKKTLKIKKNFDSYSVYKKLTKLGKKQIREILFKLKNNKIKSFPQKSSAGNFWRKRSEMDGKIDWRMNAENINNLVKALAKPYPGAHFLLNKKKIVVWKSQVMNFKTKNIEPGKVIKSGKNLIIKCGDKALKLISYQPKANFKKIKYL